MDNGILITRKQDEPGATTLAVEAPVDVVQSAERRAANYYAKRAKVPGFRKGKVPPEVIRRRYGDAIKESVIRELVSDSWKLALDREQLEPLSEPRVQALKFQDGEPVTFEFFVEVKPAINLGRLGGFALQRKQAPVTDEMVEAQLDDIRRQKAPWVPVDGERARQGDLVSVTVATGADEEAKAGREYQIVLGQGQAMPSVEEKIGEMDVGQTLDTTVTFPDDFPDESKRGQALGTTITLHDIKRQDLPEASDAFAREVGDFDTIAALRQAIRDDLEQSAKRDADSEVRRQVIDQVTAANNVPAPRPMVDRLLRAYAEAYEVPEAQLEKFAAEFGPIVEGQVKRDLVIEQVAREHELLATEEDLDDRVAQIAARRGAEPGRVYADLQGNNRLKDLERSITEEKVFEYLLGQSTITDS